MKKTGADKSTVKTVLKYLKKYIPLIALSLLLAAATVAMTLYVPILIGRAIDLITEQGKVDFNGIKYILTVVMILVAATGLLQWFMNLINNKVTYQVVRDIRKEAFEKIMILPLSYIDSHSYGQIVSRVIADTDQFADGLLMGFTQFFTGVITILGTLAFMLSINYVITLAVVFLTPLSLFVARFIAKKTYAMFKLQSETRGEQTGYIDEMITNAKTVAAFSREEKNSLRFGFGFSIFRFTYEYIY